MSPGYQRPLSAASFFSNPPIPIVSRLSSSIPLSNSSSTLSSTTRGRSPGSPPPRASSPPPRSSTPSSPIGWNVINSSNSFSPTPIANNEIKKIISSPSNKMETNKHEPPRVRKSVLNGSPLSDKKQQFSQPPPPPLDDEDEIPYVQKSVSYEPSTISSPPSKNPSSATYSRPRTSSAPPRPLSSLSSGVPTSTVEVLTSNTSSSSSQTSSNSSPRIVQLQQQLQQQQLFPSQPKSNRPPIISTFSPVLSKPNPSTPSSISNTSSKLVLHFPKNDSSPLPPPAPDYS